MPIPTINTESDDDSPISPAERAAAASRSTWVSVVVNVLLSTAQIVVGVLSKSQGLIADGIHSLSDLVSDFVVLLANRHSQKDADEDVTVHFTANKSWFDSAKSFDDEHWPATAASNQLSSARSVSTR